MYFSSTRFSVAFAFLICWSKANGYVSKCSNNGFKCASCEELIHCIGSPSKATQDYRINLINRCNNTIGEFCSAEKGGCVKDASACQIFGQQQLHCEDTGAFPDPYDCNSYHMCIKKDDAWISTKHNCPEDRAFDSLTATCRFKLTHRVCNEKPVETCMRPLQNGPLVENPNIYYVCVQNDATDDATLEPRLYKCKPNHVYWQHACIENGAAAATNGDAGSFVCEKPGNLADPRNCYAFYECDSDLKFTHKICRQGTYFDSKEAICVVGTC